MKRIMVIIIAILFISGISSFAQEESSTKNKNIQKIEIKTSAQCEMCKERIEKDMAFEKGVKTVNLDLETKVLTITYKEDKTDPKKLREAVSKIGYDADDVLADPKAYDKLPDCCKKGGHDH